MLVSLNTTWLVRWCFLTWDCFSLDLRAVLSPARPLLRGFFRLTCCTVRMIFIVVVFAGVRPFTLTLAGAGTWWTTEARRQKLSVRVLVCGCTSTLKHLTSSAGCWGTSRPRTERVVKMCTLQCNKHECDPLNKCAITLHCQPRFQREVKWLKHV